MRNKHQTDTGAGKTAPCSACLFQAAAANQEAGGHRSHSSHVCQALQLLPPILNHALARRQAALRSSIVQRCHAADPHMQPLVQHPATQTAGIVAVDQTRASLSRKPPHLHQRVLRQLHAQVQDGLLCVALLGGLQVGNHVPDEGGALLWRQQATEAGVRMERSSGTG